MAYNEIFTKEGERWARLGEHEWKLPEMPKKKDIWFSDLPKVEQYWRRPDDFIINPKYPNIFYNYVKGITELDSAVTEYNDEEVLISLSHEDSLKLIELRDREMQRRWDGVWFMNNGEPTYITGSHYFQLTWCQVADYKNKFAPKHPWKENQSNNYGDFRKFQMYLHYFLQMCKDDSDCVGAAIAKAKKTGATLVVSCDLVDESTKMREKFFGMMSKSSTDAKDANFTYYEYALLNLPDIFLPNISNDTTTSYVFKTSKIKRTGTKTSAMKRMDSKAGLGNVVKVLASKKDAFDGVKWYRAILDEWIKYDGPYIKETFDATKETVKVGMYEITGKIWMISYASESNGRSFKEAKVIYKQSALSTKGSDNRTISGLYKYHISVLDSSEGTFNIYGESDREKVRRDILAYREKIKDNPSDVITHMRQYSIDEQETWMEGGGGENTFDNIRLGAQCDELEAIAITGSPDHIWGYLDWKTTRMGEVIFIPLSQDEIMQGVTAPFCLYDWKYMNDEMFNIPFKKQLRDSKGHFKPDPNTILNGATDSTDYSRKSDVSAAGASKNAITCEIMQDDRIDTVFGLPVTNRLWMDYLERFEDPDEYYEHLVMTILWTGGYWYVEGNKPWVHTKLVKDGLQNFLLYRNRDTGAIEPYNAFKYKEGKQVIPATINVGGKKTSADIVISIKRHHRKPMVPTDVDRITWLKSIRVIKQLMDFDPGDTKKSDIAMSYGLNQLGKDGVLAWRSNILAKKNNYDAYTMKQIFQEILK